MGCYGINGEGKGLKSFFFSFVFFCVGGFPHLGGKGGWGGGLAHSEKTHCRAFGSLFDRVAWETEQWIELIRFTIFAQRRKEGGEGIQSTLVAHPSPNCVREILMRDFLASCQVQEIGLYIAYAELHQPVDIIRGPFIFTITTYVIGPFSYHGSCL